MLRWILALVAVACAASPAHPDVMPIGAPIELAALRTLEEGPFAAMQGVLDDLISAGLVHVPDVRGALERRMQRVEARLVATGELERAAPVIRRHERVLELRERALAALRDPSRDPRRARATDAALAELRLAWNNPETASFGPEFADAQRDHAYVAHVLRRWHSARREHAPRSSLPAWTYWSDLANGRLTVRTASIDAGSMSVRRDAAAFADARAARATIGSMSFSPAQETERIEALRWWSALDDYRAMLGLPALRAITTPSLAGRASAWTSRVDRPTVETIAASIEVRRALARPDVATADVGFARDQVRIAWRVEAAR